MNGHGALLWLIDHLDHVRRNATSPFLIPNKLLILLTGKEHVCRIRNTRNRDLA
jgi:hypothetical protein